jgi:hypothetical protein
MNLLGNGTAHLEKTSVADLRKTYYFMEVKYGQVSSRMRKK